MRLLAGLLSTPLDSPFSPPGRLSLLPPPSLLYRTLNLFVCSRLWRTIRELIIVWISLTPFDSPFYPAGHLCLLLPSSRHCVTPCTYLRDPDCGEHKRKWLLASLLSPLLIPPLLLLVTSIPPPSSILHVICVPLQVSLTVEKLFFINLDVLSSVLYKWRSLEATVRIRLKTRGKRLKSKSWEHQRTPESREH